MKKSKCLKRLYRSREDKVVAGVCGGIAEHFNIDPVWVRLAAVLTVFMDGIGIILYLIAWILIPENPNQKAKIKTKAEEIVIDVNKKHKKGDHAPLFGLFLVCLGSYVLLRRYIPWLGMEIIFPIALIGIGIYLFRRKR